jgi:hypothetical protein
MEEVDASIDADATVQPDDCMSLMAHYDIAHRVLGKIDRALTPSVV